MLLWFWGSSGKRNYFALRRKQLSSYLKVRGHQGTIRGIGHSFEVPITH